jgi:hypothetical protein
MLWWTRDAPPAGQIVQLHPPARSLLRIRSGAWVKSAPKSVAAKGEAAKFCSLYYGSQVLRAEGASNSIPFVVDLGEGGEARISPGGRGGMR